MSVSWPRSSDATCSVRQSLRGHYTGVPGVPFTAASVAHAHAAGVFYHQPCGASANPRGVPSHRGTRCCSRCCWPPSCSRVPAPAPPRSSPPRSTSSRCTRRSATARACRSPDWARAISRSSRTAARRRSRPSRPATSRCRWRWPSITAPAWPAPRLRVAAGAARRFLNRLRPEDQVMILGVSSEVTVLAPLSLDRAAHARAIDGLRPWSATSLNDAMIAGIDLIQQARGRRGLSSCPTGRTDTARRSPTRSWRGPAARMCWCTRSPSARTRAAALRRGRRADRRPLVPCAGREGDRPGADRHRESNCARSTSSATRRRGRSRPPGRPDGAASRCG